MQNNNSHLLKAHYLGFVSKEKKFDPYALDQYETYANFSYRPPFALNFESSLKVAYLFDYKSKKESNLFIKSINIIVSKATRKFNYFFCDYWYITWVNVPFCSYFNHAIFCQTRSWLHSNWKCYMKQLIGDQMRYEISLMLMWETKINTDIFAS